MPLDCYCTSEVSYLRSVSELLYVSSVSRLRCSSVSRAHLQCHCTSAVPLFLSSVIARQQCHCSSPVSLYLDLQCHCTSAVPLFLSSVTVPRSPVTAICSPLFQDDFASPVSPKLSGVIVSVQCHCFCPVSFLQRDGISSSPVSLFPFSVSRISIQRSTRCSRYNAWLNHNRFCAALSLVAREMR